MRSYEWDWELGATSGWATRGGAFEWNKTAAFAGAVEGHSRHREQNCGCLDLGIPLANLMDKRRLG